MDLTEAEDIKKRWQEYTEELYKKDLHDPDNHDGVEPDILECAQTSGQDLVLSLSWPHLNLWPGTEPHFKALQAEATRDHID